MKNLYLFTVCSLCLFIANAQTNVSGGIYANTTWTLANSPYIVTGDIAVSAGYTLTIEAGVTVKFNDGFHLQMNQSGLVALGTSTAPITFTSNSPSPQPGSWQGIQLLATSIVSTFSYCHFLYAYNAIDKYTGSLNIKHCLFRFNNYGVFDDSGGAPFLIDSSSFTDNANYGIYQAIAATIHSCNFSNNNYGMWARSSHIENCVIDSNNTGILCTGAGYDSIINCQIMHNGIGFADNDLSTFFGNGGNNVLLSNKIENNTIGLKIWTSDEQITCNTICGNASFDLYFNGSIGTMISVPNNYWCITDSATIAAKIYDGYDNLNLGLVTFIPFDTLQCYLTGCNLSVSATIVNATCDTCHTGSAMATIAHATSPLTYTWNTSPIQNTQTATGLAPGTYTICVIDGNGCTACKNVFIDSSNCSGFSASAQATNATCSACNDGSAHVTIIGGISPYNYTWYTSPIQTTANATALPQGAYQVCVSDAHGCIACDSAVVSIGNCSAHFNLYPDSILHNYTAVNMASGNGPLSYLWNWGDGTTDNTPYPNHTYASAGLYSICLSITDSVGCTNTYCSNFYLQHTTNTVVHVNVVHAVSTGIQSAIANPQFAISPNPATTQLNISVDESLIGAELNIYNVTGAVVTKFQISNSKSQIDCTAFATGIYIAEVKTSTAVQRVKWVKM